MDVKLKTTLRKFYTKIRSKFAAQSDVTEIKSLYSTTTTSTNPLLNKEQIHELIQQNAAAIIGADTTMTLAFPCYSEGHATMIGMSPAQSLEKGHWYKIHNSVVTSCDPQRTEGETATGLYVTSNDTAIVQYDETKMFFIYDNFKYQRVWSSDISGGYFIGQNNVHLTINFHNSSTPYYMWLKENPRTDVWFVFALTIQQMTYHSNLYVFEYTSDPGDDPTLDFSNPTATIPVYYPTTKYSCIASSTATTLPSWAFSCVVSEMSFTTEQLNALNSTITLAKVAKYENMGTTISTISSDLTTAKSNITELQTTTTSHTQSIAGLNTSKVSVSAFQGLTGTVTALDTRVTTAETKLATIANGAEVNVQSDWDEDDTTSDAYIENKPTNLSDFTNDSNFITKDVNDLTNYYKKTEFADVATSGSYNDLVDTPTIPTVNDATLTIKKNGTLVNTFTANSSENKEVDITVPTKITDLTNDSDFITKDVNDLTNYTKSSDLKTVATSGSYNDLSDKPTIPSISGLATETYVQTAVSTKANQTDLDSLEDRTEDIEGVVSTSATSTNKLLSYNEVVELVQTNSAKNILADENGSGPFEFESSMLEPLGVEGTHLEDGPWYKSVNGTIVECDGTNYKVDVNDLAIVKSDESMFYFFAHGFKFQRIKTGIKRVWGSIRIPGGSSSQLNATSASGATSGKFVGIPCVWFVEQKPTRQTTDKSVVWVIQMANIIQKTDAIEEYVMDYNADITINDIAAGVEPTNTFDLVFPTTKYICNTAQTASSDPLWTYGYTINESSFSSEELEALSSGITEAKVAQITTNTSQISSLQSQMNSKQDILSSGSTGISIDQTYKKVILNLDVTVPVTRTDNTSTNTITFGLSSSFMSTFSSYGNSISSHESSISILQSNVSSIGTSLTSLSSDVTAMKDGATITTFHGLETAIATKQDTLSEGSGISISDNTISLDSEITVSSITNSGTIDITSDYVGYSAGSINITANSGRSTGGTMSLLSKGAGSISIATEGGTTAGTITLETGTTAGNNGDITIKTNNNTSHIYLKTCDTTSNIYLQSKGYVEMQLGTYDSSPKGSLRFLNNGVYPVIEAIESTTGAGATLYLIADASTSGTGGKIDMTAKSTSSASAGIVNITAEGTQSSSGGSGAISIKASSGSSGSTISLVAEDGVSSGKGMVTITSSITKFSGETQGVKKPISTTDCTPETYYCPSSAISPSSISFDDSGVYGDYNYTFSGVFTSSSTTSLPSSTESSIAISWFGDKAMKSSNLYEFVVTKVASNKYIGVITNLGTV